MSEVVEKDIQFVELGVSGLNHNSIQVQEDFLRALQYPQAAKVYTEMSENDPTIGAVLYMIEQLIKKVDWIVKPAGETRADKKAAQFLQECKDDLEGSWDAFISEALSCLPYGFSFHEIVFKVREGEQADPRKSSKYSDGRIGWAAFPGRSQNSLVGWRFDDRGHATHFTQSAPPAYQMVDIALDRGMLFRTKVSRDNPEGRSIMRNAYRPWFFKKRIEEIEAIGIERDLAGLPMIQPPGDVNLWDKDNPVAREMLQASKNIVQNVRRDKTEGVVIPHGWEFKLLSTGGTRQFDTNAIINRYDNRIAITMLSDIVMMGGDKVGSFALGDVKKSLLAASLEAHIWAIADVINRSAVARLFRYNAFPGMTGNPQLIPGEIETPDIQQLAFLLRSGGLQPGKDLELMNLIRRLISLDPLTKEQLEEMYAQEDPELDNPGNLSADKDPLGHKMDDLNHNYEPKS